MRLKPVTAIDYFGENVVRRTVQEFYSCGEYPTRRELKDVLNDKIGFFKSITSL